MPSYNRLQKLNKQSPSLKSKEKLKFIFVSGGVISGLGKGVTAASIAMLLAKRGYKVCPIKCENNLNVDFGTINPIEHGDPFLCHDGLESDPDLGNYERFLNQLVGHDNFMTMGELYQTVINRERRMEYNGEDVEPIPMVVDEIINRCLESARKSNADFVIVELGGTVGEYENNNGLYYEAARRLAFDYPVAHVHVTYVPVPQHIGEPKTKPAQMGIKYLMSMGIYPNFLVIRSEVPVDDQRKYKFVYKFNLPSENVISAENLDHIESVPVHLKKQGLDKAILKFFGVKSSIISKEVDISNWESYLSKLRKKKDKKVTIAIIGKYFATGKSRTLESYYALIKALEHSKVFNNVEIDFRFLNSEENEGKMNQVLKGVDGIIVPIGWGSRGVEGKIEGIKYAREHKIPYLGLCFGMQLAVVEYARNICGFKDANSQEVNPKSSHKVIHEIPFDPKYQTIKGDGCSMRLGTFPCKVKQGTLLDKIYESHKSYIDTKNKVVEERHRHRYEFNNAYRELLEKSGLVISGVSPDDFFVEFIELPKEKHPFFVATQGHPEYKSSPLNPHPIFIEFIKAAKTYRESK